MKKYLNEELLTNEEKVRQNAYEISQGINAQYTYDEQLAIIFNAIELIVEQMEDCPHKAELQQILAFRKQVKKEVKED